MEYQKHEYHDSIVILTPRIKYFNTWSTCFCQKHICNLLLLHFHFCHPLLYMDVGRLLLEMDISHSVSYTHYMYFFVNFVLVLKLLHSVDLCILYACCFSSKPCIIVSDNLIVCFKKSNRNGIVIILLC